MNNLTTSAFMENVITQFQYYKSLGDKTFAQLKDEDFLWRMNADSNSVAAIVKHMWGNMMSRWTDLFESDGEKEWRKRDEEFDDTNLESREAILQKWEQGWTCLFDALKSINENNFDQLIYIRSKGHTVQEAIHRQMTHYAYHVGQIVFVGKLIKGKEWDSLSIPKGESKAFNSDSFSKGKRKEHFTDQFLK